MTIETTAAAGNATAPDMTRAEKALAWLAVVMAAGFIASLFYGYWRLGQVGQHHHTYGQMAALLMLAAIPMACSSTLCCACWMMSIRHRRWAAVFVLFLVAILVLAAVLAGLYL